jgi:hypothetical protein
MAGGMPTAAAYHVQSGSFRAPQDLRDRTREAGANQGHAVTLETRQTKAWHGPCNPEEAPAEGQLHFDQYRRGP